MGPGSLFPISLYPAHSRAFGAKQTLALQIKEIKTFDSLEPEISQHQNRTILTEYSGRPDAPNESFRPDTRA